jgi:hypothetical protein
LTQEPPDRAARQQDRAAALADKADRDAAVVARTRKGPGVTGFVWNQ